MRKGTGRSLGAICFALALAVVVSSGVAERSFASEKDGGIIVALVKVELADGAKTVDWKAVLKGLGSKPEAVANRLMEALKAYGKPVLGGVCSTDVEDGRALAFYLDSSRASFCGGKDGLSKSFFSKTGPADWVVKVDIRPTLQAGELSGEMSAKLAEQSSPETGATASLMLKPGEYVALPYTRIGNTEFAVLAAW